MAFVDQFEPEDARDFLREVIQGGHLSGKELGITQLLVDKGPEHLSPAQGYVLERAFDGLIVENCVRGHEIQWDQRYEARSNGGYCGYCRHQLDKAD